jgi:hypothetical protein
MPASLNNAVNAVAVVRAGIRAGITHAMPASLNNAVNAVAVVRAGIRAGIRLRPSTRD